MNSEKQPEPSNEATGAAQPPKPSTPCDDSSLTAWEAAVLAEEGSRFTIEELRTLSMGLL